MFFIDSIHSIDIQYVLHHALQYFNVYSLFALIILTYLLTFLHSYPKSRDAIASKKVSMPQQRAIVEAMLCIFIYPACLRGWKLTRDEHREEW